MSNCNICGSIRAVIKVPYLSKPLVWAADISLKISEPTVIVDDLCWSCWDWAIAYERHIQLNK